MSTVDITIREGQGFISGLPPDPEVMDALKLATSFRPVGYQYTTLFKKGRSDGRIKLLKHSKFPAGLLERITGVLDKEGVPYRLSIQQNADTKPNLRAVRLVGLEDREYQLDAAEAAMLNPRGVIRAPTGSGKTAVGARVIAGRGRHATVLVPTIDLLYQYKQFLAEHLLYDGVIGQLGDGTVDPQPVTVATVRTMAKVVAVAYEKYEYGEYDDQDDTQVDPKALRRWVQEIGTLIVDEAHILGAQTVYDIATKVPAPNKYGMSASPWRDDGADLMIEGATGRVIYRISTEELVKDGYLVPPLIQIVDTSGWYTAPAYGQVCTHCGAQRQRDIKNRWLESCTDCGRTRFRSEWGQAEKEQIVDNAIRNAKIAEIVKGVPKPALVLVKQVRHGKMLEQLIRDSRFLSGKDAGVDRTAVYDQIRRQEIDVLVATTIADLGLDVPALRTLVLAGGGKSSTRHLQRIGRIARPFPGKTSALVVDFDDSHVHKWFREHLNARRKIEKAEWGKTALWVPL